jgi:hypothetical protein
VVPSRAWVQDRGTVSCAWLFFFHYNTSGNALWVPPLFFLSGIASGKQLVPSSVLSLSCPACPQPLSRGKFCAGHCAMAFSGFMVCGATIELIMVRLLSDLLLQWQLNSWLYMVDLNPYRKKNLTSSISNYIQLFQV